MTLTFFTPLENAEFEPKVVEAVAWWWELDMGAGATRPLQQCIGSLVEDVLFCGNALIKTFYCFLLPESCGEIAEQVENMWNCCCLQNLGNHRWTAQQLDQGALDSWTMRSNFNARLLLDC